MIFINYKQLVQIVLGVQKKIQRLKIDDLIKKEEWDEQTKIWKRFRHPPNQANTARVTILICYQDSIYKL